MKLVKPTRKIKKYTQAYMLTINLLAVYGECTGTYLNCGAGSTYTTCTGNYTKC